MKPMRWLQRFAEQGAMPLTGDDMYPCRWDRWHFELWKRVLGTLSSANLEDCER